MGLRLVDDGKNSGDDRAALAEARRSVVDAKARLQALADRLAELRGRLGGEGPGAADTAGTTGGTGYRTPSSGE